MPVANVMDMHVHSVFSDAARNTLETITAMANKLEMGACICDHNEIRGSIALFSKGEIATIPSIEIGSAERLEFLLYFREPGDLERFYVKEVEPFKRSRFYAKLERSFEALLLAAKEHHATVALPHPYAPSWKNVNFGKQRRQRLFQPGVLAMIDLVEVINGHLTEKRNFKAFLLSEMFNKSPIAGSDSHDPETIGSVYCQLSEPLDHREMLDVFTSGIKVGMNQKFSMRDTATAGKSVISSHVKLFVSRRDQKRWMVKYETIG
jgi:predicted metal-dependent phosphoesterase TrpH